MGGDKRSRPIPEPGTHRRQELLTYVFSHRQEVFQLAAAVLRNAAIPRVDATVQPLRARRSTTLLSMVPPNSGCGWATTPPRGVLLLRTTCRAVYVFFFQYSKTWPAMRGWVVAVTKECRAGTSRWTAQA
jgi:hypothetical protein